MIVTTIQNAYKYVLKNKYKCKAFVFGIALLLILPRTFSIRFMWQETLCGTLAHRNLFEVNDEVVLGGRPNEETIFIVCEDVDYIYQNLRRLDIFTKGLEISTVDKPGNYFVKIFLHDAKRTRMLVNPLNFAPNSELYALGRNMFRTKFTMKCTSLLDNFCFRNNRWGNTMHINLAFSDIDKFLWFVRHINNLYSHYYGIYFYTPFGKKGIKADMLSLFTLAIIVLGLFDQKIEELTPTRIFCALVFYKMCPLTCLLWANKKYASLFGFVFLAIDHKFAYLYAVVIYGIYVKEYMIKMYLKCKTISKV